MRKISRTKNGSYSHAIPALLYKIDRPTLNVLRMHSTARTAWPALTQNPYYILGTSIFLTSITPITLEDLRARSFLIGPFYMLEIVIAKTFRARSF